MVQNQPLAPSTLDTWACPIGGCDFEISATGPATAGEPDEFQTDIDLHRDGHLPIDVFRCRVCGFTTTDDDEQTAHVRAHTAQGGAKREIHDGWNAVGAIPIWRELRELPEVFDAIAAVATLSPAAVAAALRSVADVLDAQ